MTEHGTRCVKWIAKTHDTDRLAGIAATGADIDYEFNTAKYRLLVDRVHVPGIDHYARETLSSSISTSPVLSGSRY